MTINDFIANTQSDLQCMCISHKPALIYMLIMSSFGRSHMISELWQNGLTLNLNAQTHCADRTKGILTIPFSTDLQIFANMARKTAKFYM